MKPQIKEYNCETGIEIVRDATQSEIDKMQNEIEIALLQEAKAEAKAQARQAILDRLGLTADEAKLILG